MLLTRYTLIAIFSAYILAIVKKCAQKTYMYTQTHTHTHNYNIPYVPVHRGILNAAASYQENMKWVLILAVLFNINFCY